MQRAMKRFDRRGLLSTLSGSLATLSSDALAPVRRLFAEAPKNNVSCWLDVCAPFIVEDAERGFHAEIILTSDAFAGASGHQDGADATDYEIYLCDAT